MGEIYEFYKKFTHKNSKTPQSSQTKFKIHSASHKKTALLKKPFELKFKNQKFFSLFLTNANNLFTALKRKQYSLNAHFACIDIVV